MATRSMRNSREAAGFSSCSTTNSRDAGRPASVSAMAMCSTKKSRDAARFGSVPASWSTGELSHDWAGLARTCLTIWLDGPRSIVRMSWRPSGSSLKCLIRRPGCACHSTVCCWLLNCSRRAGSIATFAHVVARLNWLLITMSPPMARVRLPAPGSRFAPGGPDQSHHELAVLLNSTGSSSQFRLRRPRCACQSTLQVPDLHHAGRINMQHEKLQR